MPLPQIGFKVFLKGGLTLLGILAIIGSAIGDVFTSPDTFQVVFYAGFGSVCLGLIFMKFLGHD